MNRELQIADLKCEVATPDRIEGVKKMVYMIYPAIVPFPDGWAESMAEKYGVGITIVYIPAEEWNNYLTPWPEAGETPDSPPFGGEAPRFRAMLEDNVLPAAEKAAGLMQPPERLLVGVSLSGLFTLWDWMQSGVFRSIGCLSGSFWYAGFLDWFEKMAVPGKDGKAYFLLGRQEPHAHIKAYRTVGVNTETIVERLKAAGVSAEFEWVAGNHFADSLGRAEKALEGLLG